MGLSTGSHRTHRNGAEKYDREFVGHCDEDLNTTLTFVSFRYLPHMWIR